MARWEFGKLSTSEQNCFYHLIQDTIVSNSVRNEMNVTRTARNMTARVYEV